MGNALIGESDPEERQKIQARIKALTSQFAALDASAQTRMNSLEGALQKATVYEDQSNQFDKWLHGVEVKLSSWEPFSIASQPLKRQLEAIQVHTTSNEVSCHVHGMCMSCARHLHVVHGYATGVIARSYSWPTREL